MTLFPLSSSAEPWTTTPASEKPQNSLQAWFWYKEVLKATEGAKKAKPTINMTQTALLRYAIPGWGGPTPLGERVIPSEADKGFDFLEKQVSLLQFRTCQAVVELEFEKRKTDGRTQSRYRFYMKKLSEWLESQSSWWNASQANTVEKKKLYKFCQKNDGKIPLLEVRLSNARKTKAFALGTRDELYITSTLEGQLQQFKQSLVKGELGDKLREVTANRHVTEVKRILGWFYLNSQELITLQLIPETFDLDKLCLEQLIPQIKLKLELDEEDTPTSELLKQWKAQKQAKRVGETVEKLAQNYLDYCDSQRKNKDDSENPLHPNSKAKMLTTWINLAKFIYKEETDKDETHEFEDISAVRRLRKLRQKYEKEAINAPETIDKTLKMIEWEQLLETVKILRIEADLKVVKSGGKERSKTDIAKSKQRFLLLSFMTLLPPDRQRTYRELKVGETLRHGLLFGSKFIPFEELKESERPNAKWYIYLEPGDYKTGNAYGRWCGEVPNLDYADGKTFYGYIEEWLTEWRQVFNPKHDYLFTQHSNGEQTTTESLKQLVRTPLYRLTGVPVTPHVLRNMYVTYLKRNKAPAEVMDAVALAMHHSRRMQDEVYNSQEQQEKLAPGLAYTFAVVQQIFRKDNSILEPQ